MKLIPRRLLAIIFLGFVAPICVGAEENADFLRGEALYQHGAGDAADFPDALASLKIAAKAGHTESQFLVGRMYHLGHGVVVDLVQAEYWYRQAAEKGHAYAWNNLGNVAGDLGRTEEEIVGDYMRSSELGCARGSFSLAASSFFGRKGVTKNHLRALEYFRKALAQQPDYPEAWNNIGLIYQRGEFGVEKDIKAAEAAYLNGVRVNEDAYSYYNLYWMYWLGKVPATHGPAIGFLEKAAEHGNIRAAARAGDSFRYEWGCKADLMKSVHYYDLAAAGKHGWSIQYLGIFCWNEKQHIEAFGQEVTSGWRTRYEQFETAARKQVLADLIGVRFAFDAGDQKAAKAALNTALERWKATTLDEWYFVHAMSLWTEAQINSGREHAEWGRFIFTWLVSVYEGDKRNQNILAARHNMNGYLNQLGRYGLLRESCTQVKGLLRELEGIDFDTVRGKLSVDAGYRVIGAENIPVLVDVDEMRRSRRMDYVHLPARGELIGGEAMTTMWDLATSWLSVGDWETVLIVAEWVDRWVEKVHATNESPPRDYPGCLHLLEEASGEMKGDAFSALGLPDKEAVAWQSVINLGYKDSYGGRMLHKANYRLAGVRVDQGRANEVDTEALRVMEDEMRLNSYENNEEWMFAKLVRAQVLASVGDMPTGMTLANEVLSASAKNKHHLIRLESLLVTAGLILDDSKTEGVEPMLIEALTCARSNGLLLKELRIYEIYVRYLIAIGDYDQALEMQRRVLSLIEALKLTPRLDAAKLQLAKIYGLRNEADAARAVLSKIKAPELASEVEAIEESLKRDDDKPGETAVVASEAIDLQPLGIQSMPVRDGAEAVFILTNPNPQSRSVEVKFHSESFGLTVERATQDEIALRCETGVGDTSGVVTIDVAGGRQVPITLTANGAGAAGIEAEVTLQAKIVGSSAVPESQWKIVPDVGETLVAVVDAARLRHNPFYLVPVYHHLAAVEGQAASVALRVVASEPTRVEGFAADGSLLFVDAQGNGSFGDPGDLIATDAVRELFPLLSTGGERDRIALRYAPESGCANGRVEIRIETKLSAAGEIWKTDAIDWLEP